MCIIKIGEVVKVSKKTALVKFKGKIQKVNISLLGDVKLKDKIIFSGGIALERVEDED